MRTAISVLLATLCSSVLAQSGEDGFFTDLPVVLSASRLSQPLRDAPGSMTIIDRETIKRTGARDLADVLRWVPGFQVAQSTNLHSAPVAVYHGLWTGSAGAMQVLVDGRTVYSPLFLGGVNFDALPVILEDVERIEILRGSNSATYGSNAMQGVINIITTDPSLARGGAVAVSAGNQGVRDAYARMGWGSEDFSQRLSVSRQYDDGLAYFRDFRQTLKFDWRGDLRLSNSDEVRLIAGGVQTRMGVGNPAGSGAFGAPDERDRDYSSFHLQGEWTRQLAGNDSIRVRYFHVRESMNDSQIVDTNQLNFFNPPATFKLGYYLEPKTDRDDIELQHTLHIGDAKRVVWGMGWRNDAARSQYSFGNTETINTITKRLFGHLEWRPAERWLLNLGGTWEKEGLSGSTFSPRAMVNFQPTNEQTIRFGASRSYRTPSVFEQRSNVILSDPTWPVPPAVLAWAGLQPGTPLTQSYRSEGGLKPERLDSIELGYLGNFRHLGLVVDVRAFDEKLKDRVTFFARNLPTACLGCFLGMVYPFNFANGQDVRTRGIEYQLRWKTPWSSEVWFNQTFLRLKSGSVRGVPLTGIPAIDKQIDDIAAQAERSAPRRAESIHWMQELPLDANLTVSYSHARPTQWLSNLPALATHRVDWRLAMPFKNTWGQGEVALTARAVGSGSLKEYSDGALRYQQEIIDPRYWLSLRQDF